MKDKDKIWGREMDHDWMAPSYQSYHGDFGVPEPLHSLPCEYCGQDHKEWQCPWEKNNEPEEEAQETLRPDSRV